MIIACALQIAMEGKVVNEVANDKDADGIIVACGLQMAMKGKQVYVADDTDANSMMLPLQMNM